MTLLRVQNLRKQFGSTAAVNGISFDVGAGRCVALLGPNGAGKTTTLKMLSGLLAPTSGSIDFTVPGNPSGHSDLRTLIGYLPQYPAFYNWMTGLEFLTYVGKLAHVPARELKARTAELLEMVGLTQARKRRIGGYSGGMKQRLGIAQALVHRPKLLMLDEPVSALDPVGRREVLDMMRRIREETTILFSTHVLHDAEEISDDVLIMRRGEIAVSGTMQEVRSKHRQPLIEVEADVPLGDWVRTLRERGLSNDAEAHGNTARIVVANPESAKLAVLNDLASRGIPVNRFEVAQTSLEDLFLKVVQQ